MDTNRQLGDARLMKLDDASDEFQHGVVPKRVSGRIEDACGGVAGRSPELVCRFMRREEEEEEEEGGSGRRKKVRAGRLVFGPRMLGMQNHQNQLSTRAKRNEKHIVTVNMKNNAEQEQRSKTCGMRAEPEGIGDVTVVGCTVLVFVVVGVF